MEKYFGCGCLLFLLTAIASLLLTFKDSIIDIYDTYLAPHKEVYLEEKNNYYRNYDFLYLQNRENLVPNNYNELLNTYYTILNSGQKEVSFYCPEEYEQCLFDIKTLANDQNILSDINNYVHPFNSFSHIETEYDSIGRIKVKVSHNYTEEEISQIQNEVDRIYNELYNPNQSVENNIKVFHDYIINHSKYDIERTQNNSTLYKSDIAYGPLFQGYAVCGGYTDLMELFLEKMNVKSYKISGEKHVWNAVDINGAWKHLDLTWDDPVASDGNDYLEHNYFLIDTTTLQNMEQTEHYFNLDHYLEYK